MTVFGVDPVQAALQRILEALAVGEPVNDSVERRFVDLKEEPGRRDRSGAIRPGERSNEQAASVLAAALACMANTPGGGALLVGVSDAGDVIGTELDDEWLRHRIWEITGRALTVDAAEVTIRSRRLLVLRAPQAVEPVRVGGKVQWRVGPSCVDVDANTWHSKRMEVLDYDWSSAASDVGIDAIRPAALGHARDLLRDSGETHAGELAAESDMNLLRRLNVVTGDGHLTNAGALAFVGRKQPCLDYIRRDHSGGDSRLRLRRSGRSLLEELVDVLQAVEANNPLAHVQRGPVEGQLSMLPRRTAREAIVNGLAHREWGIAEPTVVEHVGNLLRVTSPGGFFGGVTPDNILTHPSRSRNKALTELLASLRVAEREGIGVDRMYADMLAFGHTAPEIGEVEGPYVRTTLIGDEPDVAWIGWLRSLVPPQRADAVNALLMLRWLLQYGWIDAASTARLIQDTESVARVALRQLEAVKAGGPPVIVRVAGVPDDAPPAWRPHADCIALLKSLDVAAGRARELPTRSAVAASYAQGRGRISSTELGSLVGADPTNMGRVLKALENQGILRPARTARRGKGFHYRYDEPDRLEQDHNQGKNHHGTDQ
ncbi:MAG: putative DNA binding domain-containing protein [Micropruina sp.]|nr:putative DNA binding domain-containing protein [Micropruina sp.]